MRGARPALLVLAAAAVAAPLPALVSTPVLAGVTAAVAVAGAAAGASLATAAGRPPALLAAVATAAGYVSGELTLHGWAVPLAVLAATAAGWTAAAMIAVLATRLDPVGFLVLGLVAAAGGGAAVRAIPSLGSGALGPLPPLELPLPGGRLAVLGPAGAFHLVLIAAAVSTAAAALLLAGRTGARWRAAGGDPERAAAAGLRPATVRAAALATAGVLSALGGALAAHAAGAAGPAGFGPDAAVLPLLAALLAGPRGPAAAALAAVAAGVLGGAVLPAAGWTGPPDGRSLGTGLLALGLIAALPLRRRPGPAATPAAPPRTGVPWPVLAPAGGGGLRIRDLRVAAGGGGPVLIEALDLDAAPGEILGLVGANGAGKTSVLRAVEAAARGGSGRVVRLPQEGGGWPGCTVAESLALAAAAGGGGDPGAWIRRLGLEPWAGERCERLPWSSRRLCELGRVLLLRPAVLLCDEPLAGLGGARAAAVECLRAAAAAGVAIVLADHDEAAVAALASRRLRLHGGAAELLGGPAPALP